MIEPKKSILIVDDDKVILRLHTRLRADVGSAAVRPIPIETVFMSMLLAQEKALRQIQDEMMKLTGSFLKNRKEPPKDNIQISIRSNRLLL